MARVTVEDCREVISNSNALVVIAAQRTKEIITGSPIAVPPNDDKPTVLALREISAGLIDTEKLLGKLIAGMQNYPPVESAKHSNQWEDDESSSDASADMDNIMEDFDEQVDGYDLYSSEDEVDPFKNHGL